MTARGKNVKIQTLATEVLLLNPVVILEALEADQE